jgi:hypothetical protein
MSRIKQRLDELDEILNGDVQHISSTELFSLCDEHKELTSRSKEINRLKTAIYELDVNEALNPLAGFAEDVEAKRRSLKEELKRLEFEHDFYTIWLGEKKRFNPISDEEIIKALGKLTFAAPPEVAEDEEEKPLLFDIRQPSHTLINEIQYAGINSVFDGDFGSICKDEDGGIIMKLGEKPEEYKVGVAFSVEEVNNLIKALQLSIQLGWVTK